MNTRSIKKVVLCISMAGFLAILLGGEKSSKIYQSNTSFRVMSYNIHHGRGLDGKIDLERIANVIKKEGADIVTLQEVDKGVERSDRQDIAKELSR